MTNHPELAIHDDDDSTPLHSNRLSCGSIKRVPEVLGTTRRITVARRGAEKVGEDPATKHRAGDEDEEEATAF